MKEFELTPRPQTPYPKSGDIFMDQGQNEQPPKINEQSPFKKVNSTQAERFVPPEKVEAAKKAWNAFNQYRRGEIIGSDERSTQRLAIESGMVPMAGGADKFPDPGLTNQALINVLERVNNEAARLGDEEEFDPEYLDDEIARIKNLIDEGKIPTEAERTEAYNLTKLLNERKPAAYKEAYKKRESQKPDGLWQTLRRGDFELLSKQKYDEFVNKWFDAMYEAAAGRDPTTSGALELVQRAFQEADIFLTTVIPDLAGLAELSDIFETRIRLLQMNWGAISSKSIESIQKSSFGLRAHGLLKGVTLDNGYTGEMFNRMTEFLEDERLKSERGHLTPVLANSIQEKVIEEAFRLRGKFKEGEKGEVYDGGGVGSHAGKSKKDIERAVRSAYDILVDSQRMHILASRGKELFGADAFFSDAGAAFKAFNPETFVSDKWGSFSITDQRFLEEVVQRSLVDEWLEEKKKIYSDIDLTFEQRRELGHILFKIMDSPPDFYSSGWRIKGMKTQLKAHFEHREFLKEAKARHLANPQTKNPENFTSKEWEDYREDLGKEKVKEIRLRAIPYAENLGLFIRLKTAEGEKGKAEEWKKIEKYRPEEIIRLLREKYTPEEMDRVNKAIFGTDKVKGYDEFKKEFGAFLRAVREEGFRGKFNDESSPEQIDFANMKENQRNMLVAAIGEERTKRVEDIYRSMKAYILGKKLAFRDKEGILTTKGTVFDMDYRFTDIYDKVLVTDDILIGNLEVLSESQKNFGIQEISKVWAPDIGGDAYVRNMNDLAAGHTYAEELLNFVKETNEEEKFKHAEQAAAKAGEYNGRGGQARALRHTIIPFMWASMPPGVLDTLGIEKLPFRIKMTAIEKIYGAHAKPLTQDQRREMLDKIQARLESAIQNELNELKSKLDDNTRKLQLGEFKTDEEKEELERKIAEYPQKVAEARERGKKYRRSAEKLLAVRGRDILTQKAFGVLLFLIIGTIGETMKLPLKSFKS